MIKMMQFSNEDVSKYSDAIDVVHEMFEKGTGNYFKYMIDDVIKIVYLEDDTVVVFEYKDNDIVAYDSFRIDDNFNITALGTLDYDVCFDKENGEITFINHETNFEETIYFIDREGELDVDGFNGSIVYRQYNPENDTASVMTYQYMLHSGDNNRIYRINFNRLMSVIIQKHATKKYHKMTSYIARNMSSDTYYYDLALIKDYGLQEFLNKGSYGLERDNSIKRFYKIKGILPGNYAFTFFPLCNQYNIQDMYKLIDDNGHHREPNDFILDFCNGNYKLLEEFKELSDYLRAIYNYQRENNVPSLNLVRGEHHE